MANPWDVRPEPVQGDTDDITIFAAIGRATSCWEELEVGLSWLFQHFVTDGAPVWRDPATAAYGTIVGFKGRCDMLEAAADAFFSRKEMPELREQFFKLLNLAGRFSARRNEIAHGIVVHHTIDEKEIGLLLQPSFYSTKKHSADRTPKYRMSSAEISYFQQQFWALSRTAHLILYELESSRQKRLQQ